MMPGSPEWQRLITASKVAAILGVSPWESPRSIWHKMHGDLPPEPQTEAQGRGHYLEPAILAWWRDRHDVPDDLFHWREQPTYRLGDWAAATPDALVYLADDDRVLIEAKSTNSLDDWGDPGTDAIPTYYLVQVMWQMHLSEVDRCYVPIIGPRLTFAEYVVDYDADAGAALEARMREFYDTLAADEPPPLDDTVATYEAVRKVHPDIDAGAEVELSRDAATRLLDAVTELGHAEANERRWKSHVIDSMGRAQYATCEGVRIARRQPNRSGVSFVPLPKNLPLLTDLENAS